MKLEHYAGEAERLGYRDVRLELTYDESLMHRRLNVSKVYSFHSL